MGAAQSRRMSAGMRGAKSAPPPQFEVLDVLGKGAYGEVTARRNVSTGETLAVKSVPYNVLQAERRAKVHREATVLEALQHPHVVRFRGVWVKPSTLGLRGEVLIGMEMCAGSLAELFDKAPAFTWARRHEVLAHCTAAMVYCHGKGVMHRDLKMENVLYTSTVGHTCDQCAVRSFKVADFGVARLMEHAVAEGEGVVPSRGSTTGRATVKSSRSRHFTTMAGGRSTSVVGTPLYMAAEVFVLNTYGRACDMYSLGCIMRELLTSTRLHKSRRVRFDPYALEAGIKPVVVPPVQPCTGVTWVHLVCAAAVSILPALACAAVERASLLSDGAEPGPVPTVWETVMDAPRIMVDLFAIVLGALSPALVASSAPPEAPRGGGHGHADGGGWDLHFKPERAAPGLVRPAPPGEQGPFQPLAGKTPVSAVLVLVLALVGLTAVAFFPFAEVETSDGTRRRLTTSRMQSEPNAMPDYLPPPERPTLAARVGSVCSSLFGLLIGGALALTLLATGFATLLCPRSAWACLPVSLLLVAPHLSAAAHRREVRLCNDMISDIPEARPTSQDAAAELARIHMARAMHVACFPLSAAATGVLWLTLRPDVRQVESVALAYAANVLLALVANELLRLRLRASEMEES